MVDAYFRSQTTQTESTKLEVSGKLPSWLTGILVRNGPAQFVVGDKQFKHWFDGLGMLHSFAISNQEVYYQSKFIESDDYKQAQKTGELPASFATAPDPCKSIFQRMFASFSAIPTNTAVAVTAIGKRTFTTSDIATLTEFDIDTLSTRSATPLVQNAVLAAHPASESANEMWNLASYFGPTPRCEVIAVNPLLQVSVKAELKPSSTFYYHSFGNTKQHFIVIEQPMQLSFADLATSGVRNKSYFECFHWNTKATNTIHIFNKDTNSFESIKTELRFFFFHIINAFVEKNVLTVDLCAYDDNAIVSDFYLETLSTVGIAPNHRATLRRLRIDLKTKAVSLEPLGIQLELPTIAAHTAGKPYRYCYGVHATPGSKQLGNAIVKYDFETNKHLLWQEEQVIPGEPIFVPNPKGKSEDDGLLLVICFDEEIAESSLVVLDAKTLKRIASASTPLHIPAGFHGMFFG